jgi:DNA-binding PadR family transcriptional regulator
VDRLTTVSYALLGFLASGPRSAHELDREMRRSGTQYLWPRTRSRVFKEPQNLVAHGLATAVPAGRGRTRTLYEITDSGRGALRAWLAEPGRPPAMEWEALLKVWHAHLGTRDALLSQLAVIRQQLHDERAGLAITLDETADVGYLPAERAHMTILLGEFILAQNSARLRWLDEAEARVERWSLTSMTEQRQAEYTAWLTAVRARLRADTPNR